ncbi:MAG: ABC transporter permease [Gemmatimonadota bacterium]|nr:ABC transporter permease [Gemmatimonadota bacterium]MDE2784220.1 ABC transporter permease [Gemmatimonadota bacterium]MDE2866576.1 ABC transporter permease [Gemmatimonadota bacterium]MXV94330.1 ABC transporter permease subunit [Gemmatimonadota bacterium]MYB08081.1 ABC transporter permease subunit [Gemmatimonadota bacterium]
MRTGATGIIFRREFQAYVRSPMGYIVAAVVLLLDGLLFYSTALGPDAGELLSGEVLRVFFYFASGLTSIAAVALSVRLIAEERQTGTQLLLDTSPIRDWEIVLGKFLSALAFLSVITLATLYMPLLILVNGKIAVGHILIGYLGLILLGGAVLSIGVFATALTRHQLVAVAVAAVITGVMFLLWQLSQIVGSPLSRVFAALAIHGRHFNGFMAGLLHLRDVAYYVALTYFFLFAATRVMEAKRWE